MAGLYANTEPSKRFPGYQRARSAPLPWGVLEGSVVNAPRLPESAKRTATVGSFRGERGKRSPVTGEREAHRYRGEF